MSQGRASTSECRGRPVLQRQSAVQPHNLPATIPHPALLYFMPPWISQNAMYGSGVGQAAFQSMYAGAGRRGIAGAEEDFQRHQNSSAASAHPLPGTTPVFKIPGSAVSIEDGRRVHKRWSHMFSIHREFFIIFGIFLKLLWIFEPSRFSKILSNYKMSSKNLKSLHIVRITMENIQLETVVKNNVYIRKFEENSITMLKKW
jgi:hypothetical protein